MALSRPFLVYQGCSLSPLLFIIFIETLAVSIRINKDIKGIQWEQQEHKVLFYADDIIALITHPLTSFPHLLDDIW